MEFDISQMADDELRQQLRTYGVNVGPVVASTRSFYEKKLAKLKEFGYNPPTNQSESDESNNEDEVQQSGGDGTCVNEYHDAIKALSSSKLADTSHYTTQQTRSYMPIIQPRTASPTRAAMRRNIPEYEPSDSNKHIQHAVGASSEKSAHSGGVSFWLKLIFIIVLVALVYLVIININPSAENKIPQEEV